MNATEHWKKRMNEPIEHADIAASLDRLIAGQKHLAGLLERLINLREAPVPPKKPAPEWFDADLVARLDRILAALEKGHS
jgi:hypothetical protein